MRSRSDKALYEQYKDKTVAEVVSEGWRKSRICYEESYVSKRMSLLAQNIKIAGAFKGELYYLLPNWDRTERLSYRVYLTKQEQEEVA